MWRAQDIEKALRTCPDYLPYSADIIPLIRSNKVSAVAIAPDSAEAREAIKAIVIQNECNQLDFQTIDDNIIGTVTRPTYCALALGFGCVSMRYRISPSAKILHDFGELNVLPALSLVAAIIIGGSLGWYVPSYLPPKRQKPPLTGHKIIRFVLILIGVLIALTGIFVGFIIYSPRIANWIRYPSVAEFVMRAGVITAILTAWYQRYKRLAE